MRYLSSLLVMFVVLSPSVRANPLGRIGHWISHHKVELSADAVMALALTLDDHSTLQAEHRCPTCTERNPFLHGHPSARDMNVAAAIELPVLFGVTRLGAWAGSDSDSPVERNLFLIFPSVISFGHFYAASLNGRVGHTCPAASAGCK